MVSQFQERKQQKNILYTYFDAYNCTTGKMSMITSMAQGIQNEQEIIELVKLLRQNGDKILSASSKLSLSTTLLHNLNETFSLIVDENEELESSFQVCNSSKIDIFRDIKFLHDFIQKTIGLKVTQYSTDPKVSIDITKFRHLKYLELKKIDIMLVKGLQAVRGQLESITCAGRRGISTVRQLLAKCGGDAGAAFTWGSLKHLALPHNALQQLDESLELTPWLQVLDLSHNLITTAIELDCLPHLKYVNLSYNKLESVPTFNKTAQHCLQVLVLKNNYIENINGLEGLKNIIELDLSYNCLTEHSVLWPLEKMGALVWVSLEGNPLSYHPKHRLLTVKYFHSHLRDNKFVLDHTPLSRLEKLTLSENRSFTIRPVKIVTHEPIIPSVNDNLATSNISSSPLEASTSEARFENQPSELIDSLSKVTSKCRKKRNVKEATIADNEHEKEDFQSNSENASSQYLKTRSDHLETKKQILALREKFGENNWLSSYAGTYVQDIMGMQHASTPSPSSTPVMNKFVDSSIKLHTDDVAHDLQSVNASHNQQPETTNNEHANEVGETSALCDKDERKSNEVVEENTEIDANASYDPEEENGDVYLVQKKNAESETEELFLIITAENIIEKDAVNGKVKYTWSLNSVLSCVLDRSDQVSIDVIFDTTRQDRQNRRYFLELEDAKKIVATVGEKMRVRPILLKIFKCMKCSTHFSQDAEYAPLNIASTSTLYNTGSKQLKCPTCGSTLVIETDELSPAQREANTVEESLKSHSHNEHSGQTSHTTSLQHCESYSSIGATDGGAISVSTSLVHFGSHPQAQVCCSAASLEESRESTPSVGVLTKKYESDIEVLSNPSQSSIEVLDENSKANLTPKRKQSSEDKHITLSSMLLSMPDAAAVTAGLTESSSSGSLTDSVCTAYENKSIKQSSSDEKSINTNSNERDPVFTPVTNLTSMLGGLLQSMKIGNNKASLTKSEEDSNFFSDNVQYSYTDFSSVDHRVKLHIILNIFEHETEELVFLLRADILMPSLRETFPGCLILSTSKVYVLKIGGFEGEDPQRWLLKEFSWTINRLKAFAPLPFKQGVLVELQQPNKTDGEFSNVTVLCFLQDFQRTSNFLFYITDLPLPTGCEVEFSVPEHCTILMHNLLKNAKHNQEGDAVRLLALFSSAVLKHQNHNIKLKHSAIIVTASVLLLLDDDLQWLIPGTNQLPTMLKEQTMSNLIAVEHCSTTLILNFLDEVAGLEEKWVLEFNSKGAVEAVINSIQPPWEELFSVPLQVTTKLIE